MRSPVRIEFFGDSVDSLREFDLDDQRSRGPVQHVDILPMQDVIITREMLERWGHDARARWPEEHFGKDLSDKLSFADNGQLFPGAQYLMPLTHPLDSTIFDYAGPCVLVLDEPENLREEHDRFFAVLRQRYEQTAAAGGVANVPDALFLPPEGFDRARSQHHVI